MMPIIDTLEFKKKKIFLNIQICCLDNVDLIDKQNKF